MQYSTHNNLKLMEGTDNVRRQDFVDNFNAIDNGLSKFYVATLDSTNVYKITTGLNKTSLANGYSVKVAIPSDSSGDVSLIVDSCNAVAIKKPNGSAVTNFKQNGVYSLIYYNSVFMLASGGVDDVNFSASDLLTGKTANNSDGEKVNGTMKNVGQQTATINAGGRVNISKGYHDGTGYVQANSMTKQMQDLGSTLTDPSQLVKGVKAVGKNGSLITGTATIESLGGRLYKSDSFNHIKGTETSITLPFEPSTLILKLSSTNGGTAYRKYISFPIYFKKQNSSLDIIYGDFSGGAMDDLDFKYRISTKTLTIDKSTANASYEYIIYD